MAQKRPPRRTRSTGGQADPPPADAPDGDTRGEEHGPGTVGTAFIQGNTFGIKPVQYIVVDGLCMVEGDIVLGTEEEVARRSEELRQILVGNVESSVVISGNQFRWPGCVVPFTIDAALPNQQRVRDAIAHWEANTRFRFVERTAANQAQYNDYVTFTTGGGCSSQVGRRGGQQFVWLADTCSLGNAIHEIGHVIGFWHEQSREDRDAFVTINWQNIQAGFESNFNQHISDGDDVGVYDYGSIMHYPRNAFSANGQDTIVPTDPNAQIGQRTGLSAGDIASANAMCPKLVKEAGTDPIGETTLIKDVRTDPLRDKVTIKDIRTDPITDKSAIKDIRTDPITDKIRIKDIRKDPFEDPVKNPFSDPVGPVTGKEAADDPIINPFEQGIDPLITRTIGAGVVPFGFSAAGAGDAGAAAEATAIANQLATELASVTGALAGLDAARTVLQQRYAELLAALQGQGLG